MSCPECRQAIPEGMCYECGIFFDTPVLEVSDLHNYKVHQTRDYKKLDNFKEVKKSVSGEGDAGDT